MNRKAYHVNCRNLIKDSSRSQAVTYAKQVVIFRKRCESNFFSLLVLLSFSLNVVR